MAFLAEPVDPFGLVPAWSAACDDLVPYLGERAATLLALAIAEGADAAALAAELRARLREGGDDPDAPQVTEAERLLLAWGRAVGAGPGTVPADLRDDVEATFQPRTRLALAVFAANTLAVGALAAIADPR